MGISQALYTGVTGLSVNADAMSVIANNIANANNKGFKYDRAEFGDLLSMDLGSGSAQLGRGARLTDVKTIHTQGGLAVTDALTDLAVQGQGFFVISDKKAGVQEGGGQFFTRVGSFEFDKDGFLSDSTGGHVQGYMANTEGKMSTILGDVRLVTNNIAPSWTTRTVLNVNLDSRIDAEDIKRAPEFDIMKPEETSDFNNTITIFDSHGRMHNCTVFYKRMPDTEGISWAWYAAVPSKDVMDPGEGESKQISTGVAHFDNVGTLLYEETFEDSVDFKGGSFKGQKINIDFGKNVRDEGGNGVGAATSTAADSSTVFHSQNGYEAGNLKTIKIDLDGSIRGFYTNGVSRLLGAVALGTFENIDGLQKAGKNNFFKTLASGEPRIGLPSTGTRGAVYASTLEESNVDLATQFVNMIMTQRGFQANSRSVTTTDSMIEEVVNLKR